MSEGLELIVNADDFGISEAVNRGIVDAHDRGIVTSTSIMATGPAFEHAVALARERPDLAVGVHLVLTEQRPLIGAAVAATLVGADGAFRAAPEAPPGRASPGSRLAARGSARARRADSVCAESGHRHQPSRRPPARARAARRRRRRRRARGRRTASRPCAIRPNACAATCCATSSTRGGSPSKRRSSLFCASSPLKNLRRSDDFVGFYFGGRLDEANLATVLGRLAGGWHRRAHVPSRGTKTCGPPAIGNTHGPPSATR